LRPSAASRGSCTQQLFAEQKKPGLHTAVPSMMRHGVAHMAGAHGSSPVKAVVQLRAWAAMQLSSPCSDCPFEVGSTGWHC